MFQNKQKVVVVSSGDERRVIKVQAVSGVDAGRYPTVDTTGVTGRDQQVQIVSGGDETRFPKLQGLADARATADSVISALTPAAWYRNATGVTSAGGFASQWDDYSGNTRHLVQGTGTNQPAYDSGTGVVLFDGADNYMKASAFTLNQPLTIVLVFSQISWTASDRIWDGNTVNTVWAYQLTASPNISIRGDSTDLNTNPDLSVGSYGIITAVYDGASSSVMTNLNAKATGGVGAANAAGFTLAASGNVLGNWSNIAVKECVIFPTALSDANQSAVVTALNNALTVF